MTSRLAAASTDPDGEGRAGALPVIRILDVSTGRDDLPVHRRSANVGQPQPGRPESV